MTKRPSLPPKFNALLKHDNVRRVRFRHATDKQQAVFVLINEKGESIRKCPGLTRVLQRAFPVAQLSSSITKPKQKSAWADRHCNRLPHYLVRPGVLSQQQQQQQQQQQYFVCTGISDREHGIGVDEQLTFFVQYGATRFSREYPQPDPCVASLLAYITNTLHWVPVCTQQRLHAPSLGGFATAIDLLYTDVATRSQLHVVEIKSTKSTSSSTTSAFERITGYASGALRGLPLSYCSRAQLQLWAMVYALRHDCETHIDSASVMRVSPTRVDHYELNPWFAKRERALIRRFISASTSSSSSSRKTRRRKKK